MLFFCRLDHVAELLNAVEEELSVHLHVWTCACMCVCVCVRAFTYVCAFPCVFVLYLRVIQLVDPSLDGGIKVRYAGNLSPFAM